MASSIDLLFATMVELHQAMRVGAKSPIDVLDACLRRIEALNPQLNAFITVIAEHARLQARQAAAEMASGQWRGPLHGVPVAVKDFYDTAGIRTTAGFEHFQRRVPTHDAVLVSALRSAGAVLVGKTNMHKLGMGTTSLDSWAGPVVNPWSHDHVAGGSSGGSAVAVAAGLCAATIDTDAIGSGRLPAAICGVCCLKPTFGLLSGEGILAGEPVDPAILTLGHPSIMARSAEDVASVLRAILAVTGRGATPEAESARPRRRLGIVSNVVRHAETAERFADTSQVLATMGLEIAHVEVPFAAASFDLRSVEADRAGIDATLFADVDAIVLPTLAAQTPTVAAARATGDMAVSSQHTFFANYFGLPAVTVPMRITDGHLPAGVQFVGPHDTDEELLALAAAYQRAVGWSYTPPASVTEPALDVRRT